LKLITSTKKNWSTITQK